MFCIASDETCSLPSQGMSPHRAKLTGYIITLNKVKGLARALPAFSPRLKVFFSVSRIFLTTNFFFKWKKKLIFKWKRKSSGHRNGIIDPLFRQETFHHRNCILDTKKTEPSNQLKGSIQEKWIFKPYHCYSFDHYISKCKNLTENFCFKDSGFNHDFLFKIKILNKKLQFPSISRLFFSSKSKPRTRKFSFCLATPGTKCLAPALLNIIHQYYT